MFLITRPDRKAIQKFIDGCRDDSFSYSDVGLSRTGSPPAYNIDHNRILIGRGPADFEKAKEAIRGWRMFNMPWVELCWPDTSIEIGENVAVLVDHLGFYSLNASRIVYLIDNSGPIERFGFAYGTLTDHGESGEERFSVELHRESGKVWYDLYAFSQPNHLLAKLGYPFSRYLQKRFAAASKAAMKHAVNSQDSPTSAVNL